MAERGRSQIVSHCITRGVKFVATPGTKKYLAARIVSSRPGLRLRRTVQIFDYTSLVPCALNWIWFRAWEQTDCAAEIEVHMLASPSAVKSIGNSGIVIGAVRISLFLSSYLVGLCRARL
jgi:hypothetical protein